MNIIFSIILSLHVFNCYAITLAEENIGCPENSICTKKAGLKQVEWKRLIESTTITDRRKKIKKFLSSKGIPTKFLIFTNKINQDDIIWSSRCSGHQKSSPQIVKALRFLKNSNANNIMLVPIKRKSAEYKGPYEEYPIYIENEKLIYLREHENLFYTQAITKDGNWEILETDFKTLTKSRLENSSVFKCEQESIQENSFYPTSVCKKIWNKNLQKTETISIGRACF